MPLNPYALEFSPNTPYAPPLSEQTFTLNGSQEPGSESPAVKGLRLRQQGYKNFVAPGEDRLSGADLATKFPIGGLQRDNPSTVKSAKPMASAAIGALGQAASGTVGAAFGLAGSIVGANASLAGDKYISDNMLKGTRETLGLQREMWQRDWDSANAAGLANPSQLLGGGSTGFFKNSGTGGAIPNRANYTAKSRSSYA